MQNTASLQQKPTQFKLSKITLQSLSKFNISPTAKLVLLYLIDCYNPAKVYMFPKQETIADKLGISLSSVKRAIKELAKANVIIIELKFSNRYNLTQTFFDLLNLTPDTAQIDLPKCQKELNHVITEKETDKKQEKLLFSLKFLLELSKTDTIAYSEALSNLSEGDKEKLAKIKLGRMSLTNFQRENLDKFIMLNEYEINKVNSLEPYFRQENIDIFYNARIKKIREFKENQNKQEFEVQKPLEMDKRQEILNILSTGYKAFSGNKVLLIKFLEEKSDRMKHYNIQESDLSI
ncbi:MAG: helix-turn-helix domain-containing protein [bacterium]